MRHFIDNLVLPECYIDTNLIETLVPPQRMYNHQKGCPAVAKKMKEKFSDDFALGIMDNDKRHVSYLQEFLLIAADHAIELYKHNSRAHYILLISPAVEQFVLDAASELGIDLSRYNVPCTLEDMKKETKQVDAKSCKKYTLLFKALKPATECQKLTKIISYLKKETHKAQESVLKEILQ